MVKVPTKLTGLRMIRLLMKKLAILLILLFIGSSSFNMPSANTTLNVDVPDLLLNGKDSVSEDLTDSQVFFAKASQVPRQTNNLNAKVEALLRKMTLAEKVGQMTQLEIGTVCDGSNQSLKINPAKLEKALVQYGVGSILNVSGEALTLDKWHEIIGRRKTAYIYCESVITESAIADI